LRLLDGSPQKIQILVRLAAGTAILLVERDIGNHHFSRRLAMKCSTISNLPCLIALGLVMTALVTAGWAADPVPPMVRANRGAKLMEHLMGPAVFQRLMAPARLPGVYGQPVRVGDAHALAGTLANAPHVDKSVLDQHMSPAVFQKLLVPAQLAGIQGQPAAAPAILPAEIDQRLAAN